MLRSSCPASSDSAAQVRLGKFFAGHLEGMQRQALRQIGSRAEDMVSLKTCFRLHGVGVLPCPDVCHAAASASIRVASIFWPRCQPSGKERRLDTRSSNSSVVITAGS